MSHSWDAWDNSGRHSPVPSSRSTCEDEEPLPPVGSADRRRAEHLPFRIVPERGQTTEDGAEPSRGKQAWDVFQEDVAGSHVANDPLDLRPEPALVIDTAASAGDGMGLAGKAGREEIDAATKEVAREGSQLIPDSRLIQGAVLHTRDQDRGGKGFPFHHNEAAIGSAEGELDAQLEPPDPGT